MEWEAAWGPWQGRRAQVWFFSWLACRASTSPAPHQHLTSCLAVSAHLSGFSRERQACHSTQYWGGRKFMHPAERPWHVLNIYKWESLTVYEVELLVGSHLCMRVYSWISRIRLFKCALFPVRIQRGNQLKTIEGLENLKSLQVLDLSLNRINSLSGLQNLHLLCSINLEKNLVLIWENKWTEQMCQPKSCVWLNQFMRLKFKNKCRFASQIH